MQLSFYVQSPSGNVPEYYTTRDADYNDKIYAELKKDKLYIPDSDDNYKVDFKDAFLPLETLENAERLPLQASLAANDPLIVLIKESEEPLSLANYENQLNVEFRDFSWAIPFILRGEFHGIVLYGRHSDGRSDLDDEEKESLGNYVNEVSVTLASVLWGR